MAKYVVENIRAETPAEKALDEWFQKQSLASPDTLEEAARLIIGLVTGLLGALFGVLTVASNPLPKYLSDPVVRTLGIVDVAFLLFALIASLAVVLPRRWTFNPAQPASELATFEKILNRKSSALLVATIAFGAGIAVLALTLVIVLLSLG
ncbi:MAG: hypothetical protein L0Y55_13760 [Anaerolineales bacterium]|nr:hypothetical protein [Anaerolineales bacterium]